MFYTHRSDLVIGGKIWIMYFDPNATSVKKLGLPKQFEYSGRYSLGDGNPSHLRFWYEESAKQLRIDIDDDYENFNTGHFVLSESRMNLFHRISALQRSNSSPTVKYMASEYVKYIKEEYPEYAL